jgi:hypothetical protein
MKLPDKIRVTWPMLGLLLLVIFIFPLPLLAQGPNDLTQVMVEANERYQSGQFERAAELYETINAAGVQHSTVYYNLGNAYLQQGDLGRAILNYRRAQRLDPRDGDIANNLELARAQTIDKLQASGVEQLNFGQIVGDWITLEETTVLLLVFWFLICLSLSLYIVLPHRRSELVWLIISSVGLTILMTAGLASSLYIEDQTPTAVVVASQVDVTDGPGPADEFAVNFSLHAGAEVRIIDRRLGWRQIALPGDLDGWVPNNTLSLVVGQS